MHRRLFSLYAFARARRATAVGVLAAGLAAGVALVAAGAGVASTPGSSSVTVPTSTGATETRTWIGTIPPGANPTNSCAQVANTPLVDKHAVQISVPDGLYNTVDATFTFSITWGDALHDEILTVLDPDGLPVGVQVVGPRWSEPRLLGIARELERAGVLPGFQAPPGFSS